ncbi:MAG TPA: double zinc ribbon domain-containing protein, partial [Spirochaetia bacterium]|nr:double zinc ribbon domain-containing protein [Spirochaetia bacterium]
MELVSTLIDLCFPQLCLLCGESVLLSRVTGPWAAIPLCRECLDSLPEITGERCRLCSLPLISETETCMRCRERDFPFVSNCAAFEYRGAVQELISHYKFRNQRSLALLFSSRVAAIILDRFPRIPVVPVPSRPASIRKRGWDHVGEMARLLHRNHGIEIHPLLRRSNGVSQKSLDFAHRLTNLKGRIHWSPRCRTALPDRVVLF